MASVERFHIDQHMQLFPQVEECFLWTCLRKTGNAIMAASNLLCEHVSKFGCPSKSKDSSVERASSPCPMLDREYKKLSLMQLQNMFPKLPLNDIKKIMEANACSFIRTVEALWRVVDDPSRWTELGITPLQTARKPIDIPASTNTAFQAEFDLVKKKEKERREQADRQLAEQLNAEMYRQCGDGIECGTCLEQHPFEYVCFIVIVSILIAMIDGAVLRRPSVLC